jgi:hypothetical protein
MNCEDFESNVNDLAREQMMEASVRARALAHRDECEVCARRLEDESTLSFGLCALAKEINAAMVPAPGQELLATFRGEIRSNLRSNLRSNQAVLSGVSAHRRWRYLAAVAAMILVVISVAVMRSRATSPPIVKGLSNPPSVLPTETPTAPTPDVVAGLNPVPTRSRRVSRKRKNLNQLAEGSQLATRTNKNLATTETATSDSENPAPEITTEFMPVGYASETNMEEGGQLVRVQLPRSALLAFGLPMNVNRYDEKVKADVFFGADGMARAIRFVQ